MWEEGSREVPHIPIIDYRTMRNVPNKKLLAIAASLLVSTLIIVVSIAIDCNSGYEFLNGIKPVARYVNERREVTAEALTYLVPADFHSWAAKAESELIERGFRHICTTDYCYNYSLRDHSQYVEITILDKQGWVSVNIRREIAKKWYIVKLNEWRRRLSKIIDLS